MTSNQQEQLKAKVAMAVAQRVQDGETIGIGSGSTVELAVQAIGGRVKTEKLQITAITSSYTIALACQKHGIKVGHPSLIDQLTWGFDGADQVDSHLMAIKGKGGALLKEKILAAKCKTYLLIIDQSKFVKTLGRDCPVPVEVHPDAVSFVKQELLKLGAKNPTVRQANGRHGVMITESGNMLIDTYLSKIDRQTEDRINKIVGVIDNGIFTNYASEVLLATPKGFKSLLR